MSLQPTGHTSDGSGLQNHSVSGLYPYIIAYRPYSKTFEVSHRDGVTRSSGHASYDAACAAASISKTLAALVGKRVILNHTANYKHAGTVTKAYHRARLVAVRFDTDDKDTSVSPIDLRVIL
jgi:hypothetical protein